MAKFCGNCGTQNEDIANVCGNCGTSFEAATPAAETVIDTVSPERKAQLKKQVIMIGAGVGALVVLITIISIILHFLSPRPVLDTLLNGYFKGDVDKVLSVVTEAQKERYEDNDIDIEESLEDACESFMDHFEEEVGNKPNMSFKVEDEYKLEEKKYDDLFGDDYEDYMEEYDFTEIYVYEVEIVGEKKGDDEKVDAKIYMVKEKGSWRFLSWKVDY